MHREEEDNCIAILEQALWNGIPQCPYCESARVTFRDKKLRHHCNDCNTMFSVKVNTLFHHTHLPLRKWFRAISILNASKQVTVRQLAQELEINSAHLLITRIRNAQLNATQNELLQKLAKLRNF